MGLEGARKHYSGSDVSEYVKGREEVRDRVGRGMVFLDGVDWTGFAGTKRGELGAGQAYPDRGVEGVGFVASTGEDTCTPDPVAYKEDTGRRNGVNISFSLGAITENM
jgi:hypothetical protein